MVFIRFVYVRTDVQINEVENLISVKQDLYDKAKNQKNNFNILREIRDEIIELRLMLQTLYENDKS